MIRIAPFSVKEFAEVFLRETELEGQARVMKFQLELLGFMNVTQVLKEKETLKKKGK